MSVAGHRLLAANYDADMELVMTLLVRNEVDIIQANLEYHLAQGVDFVIITDHGSEDGTSEILREQRCTSERQSTGQALHLLRSSRLMRSTALARRWYYRATGKR